MMGGLDEFDPSLLLLDPRLMRGTSLGLAGVRAVIVSGWLAVIGFQFLVW